MDMQVVGVSTYLYIATRNSVYDSMLAFEGFKGKNRGHSVQRGCAKDKHMAYARIRTD